MANPSGSGSDSNDLLDVAVIGAGLSGLAAARVLRTAGLARIAVKPILDDIIIELLAPKHTRQPLAHDIARIGRDGRRNNAAVKFICFLQAGCQRIVKGIAKGAGALAPP